MRKTQTKVVAKPDRHRMVRWLMVWLYRLVRGGLATIRLVGSELHGYSRGVVVSMTFPVSSINEIGMGLAPEVTFSQVRGLPKKVFGRHSV